MKDFVLWSSLLLSGCILAHIVANRGRVTVRWWKTKNEWEEIEPMLELLDGMN